MTNVVDLSNWPLIRAAQNGRLSVAEAADFNAGMTAVLERSNSEGVRFAVVVDQSRREAPQKGALELIHGYWAEHAVEIAERCCGYASVVATRELADLVVNPGPAGLLVMGTTAMEEAVSWAKECLAAQ
ncbi:hypothetical protein [Actinocorallia lasiicapitis]